jgi:hypothetical protein
MKCPKLVTENYRDRCSILPEDEYDLYEGEIVDMINNPGIGSIRVMKQNGEEAFVAGFSGRILKSIAIYSPLTNQEKPFIYSGMRFNRDQMIRMGYDKQAHDAIQYYGHTKRI